MLRYLMPLLFSVAATWHALAQAPDVEDMPSRFYSYYDKGDADGISSLYAEDATLYSSTGMPLIVGRQQIQEYFRQTFSSSESRHLKPIQGHWQKYGNFAIRSSTANIDVELRDGTKISVPLRATYVFQKGPQGWLIVHHHVSRESPSPANGPSQAQRSGTGPKK
jgi:ketosteroid isomerase-like protein